MRVKLKWANRNNRPVSTKIYRTDTIVPNDQLGPPLVTLDGAILEWVDTTVVYGKTYYYVFGVVGGPTELYSIPLRVDAIYSTGPGPNKLESGDQSLGYFGTVNALDLFTAPELQSLVGYPPAAVNNQLTPYDKWYRNGKILFIPRQSFGASWGWQSLYLAGLVFGVDNEGPWRPAGVAAVNQMKIVSKGFNRFIVRLPTAADDRNNPTRTVPDNATASIRKFSETADCHFPTQNQWVPVSQRYPRLQLIANSIAFINNSQPILCQEQYRVATLTGVPASATFAGSMETLVNYSVAGGGCWKPTLELIQSDFVIAETVL